jgi:serine/threonine protein kinase
MTQDVFHIVGTTIGGTYEVEKAVAEGGFGVLYRAFHGAFRAPVALKCLKVPPSVAEKDHAELLERFRKEAEVMFRLSTSIPTVVRPLHVDAFTTEEGVFVPYMVLEWLAGETLDALIIRRSHEGRPPIGLKKLVEVMTPVARALERAHKFPSDDGEVSISHCDLKPENIFLADFHGETVAKILDFGIAKVRQATSQIIGRQSQTGELSAFSPCYAAPEQWLPKRFGAAGPWTDIWGLALTLVEAAAGRQIMSNDFQAAIGSAIDEKRRPTPRNEGVKVSDDVERVFTRALAVDPKNRQANMAIFWDDLEDAVGIERSQSGRREARADGLASSAPPPPPRAPSLRPAPTLLEPVDELSLDLPPEGLPLVRAGHLAAARQLEPDARVPASGRQRVTDLDRPETFPELLVPTGHPAHSQLAQQASREPGTSPGRLREKTPGLPASLGGHLQTPGPPVGQAAVQKGVLLEAPPGDGLSIELDDIAPSSHRHPPSPHPADPVRAALPRLSGDSGSRRSADPLSASAQRAAVLEKSTPRVRPVSVMEPNAPSAEPGSKVPAWHAFRLPLAMALVGIGVAAVDGGQIQFGGVQLNWIAGAVAGVGILLALWRLFAE